MTNSDVYRCRRMLKNSIDLATTTLKRHGTIPASDEVPVIGLALSMLARTVSNARASLKLLEDGYILEANILLRNVIENTGLQCELQSKPDETLKLMRENWEKGKNARLKLMKSEIKLTEEQNVYVNDYFEEYKENYGGKHARNVRYKDAIEATKIPNMYLRYMELSADAAHPDGGALYKHVNKDGDKLIINPKVEFVDGEKITVMCILTINILISTFRMAKMADDKEIQKLAVDGVKQYGDTVIG